jgi:hypothetical protein
MATSRETRAGSIPQHSVTVGLKGWGLPLPTQMDPFAVYKVPNTCSNLEVAFVPNKPIDSANLADIAPNFVRDS